MNTATTHHGSATTWFDTADLAMAIERDGIAAVEVPISAVVARAREAGFEAVVLDVLADRREPDIARARAFGMVAVALARLTPADAAPELFATAA